LSTDEPVLLEVGRIVKPHGLRGEVSVYPITNRPELRFVAGAVLQSDRGPMEIVSARPHQAAWLVTFAGVPDRTAAETLRGRVLRAEPIEAEDDPDTLWVHELIGAEVVDTAGVSHGRVEAVEANPASDLLVLNGERLVPLVFVVSHAPGRVVIDPPAGLLD
jgi:16S rRNA processing protein RimM